MSEDIALSRRCNACGVPKALSEFPKNSRLKTGYEGSCLECRRASSRRWKASHLERARQSSREWARNNRERMNATRRAWRAAHPELSRARKLALRRKSLYGLSVADVAALLAFQDGKCAICKRDITVDDPYKTARRTRVSVDHNHVTGRIRGLLCPDCNRVLGMMHDDPALLRAAANYLESKE